MRCLLPFAFPFLLFAFHLVSADLELKLRDVGECGSSAI